jgi:hypothetical protein
MTKEDLERIPRVTAAELLAQLATGWPRQEVLIESALNVEWWRGYHAASAALSTTGGAK